MDLQDMLPGIRVQVTALARNGTDGMIVPDRVKYARRVHALGLLYRAVPGHGGDVWFVSHEDGTVAAYSYTELSRATESSVDLLAEFRSSVALARDAALVAKSESVRSTFLTIAEVWSTAEKRLLASGLLDAGEQR
jgi:hypothetical protein